MKTLEIALVVTAGASVAVGVWLIADRDTLATARCLGGFAVGLAVGQAVLHGWRSWR